MGNYSPTPKTTDKPPVESDDTRWRRDVKERDEKGRRTDKEISETWLRNHRNEGGEKKG